MRKSKALFYLVCTIVCAVFIVGTFWIWNKKAEENAHVLHVDVPVRHATSTQDYQAPSKIIATSSISKSPKPPVVPSPTVSAPVPLPPRLNLAVPFTSQAPQGNWEEPWQDACEEAAVLMLDAYYKGYGLSPIFARDELLKMVKWVEDRGWGISIPMEDIDIMAEHFAAPKKFKIVKNPTVEQIKSFIAANNPVLVVAHGKSLPNPYYSNGGPEYHALIIRGYTEDSFITNDPGTRRGENFVYKYADLMNAIHDWNGGDVKQGRKVILVAE